MPQYVSGILLKILNLKCRHPVLFY